MCFHFLKQSVSDQPGLATLPAAGKSQLRNENYGLIYSEFRRPYQQSISSLSVTHCKAGSLLPDKKPKHGLGKLILER